MDVPHVIILGHYDNSGIKQVFGPFVTREQADRALDTLSSWPAMESAGLFVIMPCTLLDFPYISHNAPYQPTIAYPPGVRAPTPSEAPRHRGELPVGPPVEGSLPSERRERERREPRHPDEFYSAPDPRFGSSQAGRDM